MKFMEPKIGQKSALISVCTLFDCKMYLFKSKLRLFPHWLNVGKSKQKNWRAYWPWLLSVSFTGLNFRFTKHIRLKIILIYGWDICLQVRMWWHGRQLSCTDCRRKHANTLGHLSCKQNVWCGQTTVPKCINNPITAMEFLAIFTFQMDSIKR